MWSVALSQSDCVTLVNDSDRKTLGQHDSVTAIKAGSWPAVVGLQQVQGRHHTAEGIKAHVDVARPIKNQVGLFLVNL